MVPLKKLLTYLPSIVNLDTILLSNEHLEKAYLKSYKVIIISCDHKYCNTTQIVCHCQIFEIQDTWDMDITVLTSYIFLVSPEE